MARLQAPRSSWIFLSLSLIFWCTSLHLAFYMDAKDSHLGLHVRVPSILDTEPSSQLLGRLYFLINSSGDEHLGCFHFLATLIIVFDSAVHILHKHVFTSLLNTHIQEYS